MKQFVRYTLSIVIFHLFLFPVQKLYSQLLWQETNSLDSFPVFCMSSIGGDLYAGMMGAGVFKTEDAGTTWLPLNNGLGSLYPSQILQKGATLFVATYFDGVYRSKNKGESWEKTSTDIHREVYALAVKGKWIFAGTNRGIYRSDNDGDSWEKLTYPLTSRLYRPIYSLLISGKNILAGSKKYIYWSTDDGDTWEAIDTEANADIPVALAHGNQIYLGTSAKGVLQASMEGREWMPTPFETAMPTNIKAATFKGNQLAIAASTIGVILDDELINEGLPTTAVSSLVWHKGNLYAGTYLDGIWKYDRPPNILPSVPIQKAIGLYPNPTNADKITLSYEVQEDQQITISLVNNEGQLLSTLLDTYQAKGSYRRTIPLNNLAPGVYYCLLKQEKGHQSQKIIILNQ